jgi:hypothetical protein
MADSVSNFKTIYEIISKADFTGLVAGAKTLEDLADKTTANTKTVQDLTDVVSAGVDGVGNYFRTYSEGFDSVTERFEKLQKDGVTVTGTISTLAGTLGDTLNAAMKQTVVGGELLGKVLSTNIGMSLAGIAVVGWTASKGLQAFLHVMNKTAEEAVRYHRGLETTRMMLSATETAARATADGMVAAANRASWTRIGASFSGYISFFHGLGDAASSVLSTFSHWGARLSEIVDSGFGGYLGELGESMRRFAQHTMESSAAYKALKLSVDDIKTNVKDAKALNEQFEEIGASLNTDTQEVRRMFLEMSKGLRDNTKALTVLQMARAAALGSDVFKANAAEFMQAINAINMGLEAPIDSLLKFGVAVTDNNGFMLTSIPMLDAIIARMRELGTITQAEADAMRERLKGGMAEAADLEQRLNRLRAFHRTNLAIERQAAEERVRILSAKRDTQPEAYDKALVARQDIMLQQSEQERLFLQYKVNTQLRYLDLIGEEASEQEKRQAQELRNFRAYRDEQLAMRKESAGLQEQYEAMLKEQHDARMARLEREYAARMNLIRAAADAASSAGQNIGGAAPGFTQLALLDKERDKIRAEISRLGAGADARRSDLLRQEINTLKQGYDIAKSNRDELNNQIISSMQTINDLSMRARRGAFETMQMVRESAQERLRMIREDQQLEGRSASERARSTMAEAQTLLSARDQMLAQYQRIGAEIGNIAKTNTATLIEQRVITQDLIATMAKGESVGLNASPATRFRLQEVAPGSAGDILTRLGQEIEGLEVNAKFDESLKAFSMRAEQMLRAGGGEEGIGKLMQEFQTWTRQSGRNEGEQTQLRDEAARRMQAAAATVYGDKFVGADSKNLERKLEEAAKVLKEESAKFYTEMEKNWNALLTANKTDKEAQQKILDEFKKGVEESLAKYADGLQEQTKDAVRGAMGIFEAFVIAAVDKGKGLADYVGGLGPPLVTAAEEVQRLWLSAAETLKAELGKVPEGSATELLESIKLTLESKPVVLDIADFDKVSAQRVAELKEVVAKIVKSAEPGGAPNKAAPGKELMVDLNNAVDAINAGDRSYVDDVTKLSELVKRIQELSVKQRTKDQMTDQLFVAFEALVDQINAETATDQPVKYF